ncbi:MAG: polysaccharide deacetylase family protein [Oscillospiraceae bacterium]|nr:polysaccharide deacetylase family protein [Oscillospiraceae bacterium]
MFVVTLTRKRAFRAALVILAVFIGIAVGIASVLTSINTGAAETRLPIYSVDRADNKISLTFDCAWGNSNTDELLNILTEHGVFATFFMTGEFVEKFPDDVRKIAVAGHEIANHSDSHPRIKGMNINELINDTREAERKITTITGTKPVLYRSPYGEYDVNSIKTVEGLGYKFIQWSVDSIDWQEPDPATIVKRVTEKTVPGSILLFHNDLDNTTKALPEVITRLRQAGFEFVKTSDLIYHDDYYIDHAGKQIKEIRTLLPIAHESALAETVEIIRSRLTYEEIASLRDGVSPQIAAKVSPHLSQEQLLILSELTVAEAQAIIAAVLNDTSAPVPTPAQETYPQDPEQEHKAGYFTEPYEQISENDIPDLNELLEGNMSGLNELFEGDMSGLNEITGGDFPNLNELYAEIDEK